MTNALDTLQPLFARLTREHGPVDMLTRYTERGSLIITDDGDAVIVGLYPGDNWHTGDTAGNNLQSHPADTAELKQAITAALAWLEPKGSPAAEHTCTADCWAYMVRYGQPDECDAFTAREAADKAAGL